MLRIKLHASMPTPLCLSACPASFFQFTSLAYFYLGRVGYGVTQLFFQLSLACNNISSIIQSVQVMDFAIAAIFGKSCATPEFYPQFRFWCPEAVADDITVFGSMYLLSIGFIITALICAPLGFWNLDDNMSALQTSNSSARMTRTQHESLISSLLLLFLPLSLSPSLSLSLSLSLFRSLSQHHPKSVVCIGDSNGVDLGWNISRQRVGRRSSSRHRNTVYERAGDRCIQFCSHFEQSERTHTHTQSNMQPDAHTACSLCQPLMLSASLFLHRSVPSWVNEKRENVSIQATMLVAMPMALLLFISIGMFGPCATAAALLCAVSCLHLQAAHVATLFLLCCVTPGGMAYAPWFSGATADETLLNKLRNSSFALAKVTFYMFPVVVNLTSIPVFAIMQRYNLLEAQVCGPKMANFLGVILPWIICIPFYTGTGFSNVVNWGSANAKQCCLRERGGRMQCAAHSCGELIFF